MGSTSVGATQQLPGDAHQEPALLDVVRQLSDGPSPQPGPRRTRSRRAGGLSRLRGRPVAAPPPPLGPAGTAHDDSNNVRGTWPPSGCPAKQLNRHLRRAGGPGPEMQPIGPAAWLPWTSPAPWLRSSALLGSSRSARLNQGWSLSTRTCSPRVPTALQCAEQWASRSTGLARMPPRCGAGRTSPIPSGSACHAEPGSAGTD